MKTPAEFAALEVTIGHWIRFVGGGIEIFGVLVIVLGIVWSIYLFLASTRRWAVLRGLQNPHWPIPLLGLEVLVAADIVKTIALDLTFLSLGLLAGLVLVRTFLSWTLVLEIEGLGPGSANACGRAAHAHLSRLANGQRARTFVSIARRIEGYQLKSQSVFPLQDLSVD